MQLAYSSHGEGAAVLILHGLFGSARNWHGVSRQLAQTHRTFVVDLRNHGDSPWADRMSYHQMADDVGDLITAERLERPIVMGHSIGGKVAMTLALERSELLAGLIVVDVAPVTYASGFSSYIEAMQGLELDKIVRRADAESALKQRIKDPAIRAFLLHNLVSRDSGYEWRINLAAIAANLDEVSGFPEFANDRAYEGPALFLYGDRSDYVRPEHHDAIRGLFPAASIDDIAGAGHWVHAEQPAQFVERVHRFLAADILDRS